MDAWVSRFRSSRFESSAEREAKWRCDKYSETKYLFHVVFFLGPNSQHYDHHPAPPSTTPAPASAP